MASALQDIPTLLTDPETFFDRYGTDPSLGGPAVLVAVIALLSAIAAGATVMKFSAAIPSGAQGVFLFGALIGAGFAVVVPFISWLLYAIVFVVVTYFFDGEGEFRDLFALVGWGFAPKVLGAVVSVVLTLVVLQSLSIPADPASFQSFNQRLQQATLTRVSSVLGIVFTLWSAYIWIPAVQRARNVTRRQAIATVAVPVAVSILLTLFGLVSSSLA